MFYDLKGLINEIENGKSTNEIVRERLEYLSSKDYQKEMIKKDSCGFLRQGFITDEDIFKITNFIGDTTYYIDEKDIFSGLVDGLRRKNIENIKRTYSLNLAFLMKGIDNYFFKNKPDIESYELVKKMKEKGWDNDRIRVGFGDILKRQRYSMLDDEMKEKMKEELEFVPIPISVIKGLGIGKCVELSLLSQNILSFLGYNTFMLQGTTILDDSKPTAHQYNFIEKDGKYCIFDAALESVGIISKIKTPEDFLDFGEITLKGIHGQEITYLSERKKMK